jgi:hypothetical protein
MQHRIEERLFAVREPVPGSWEIFRLVETKISTGSKPSRAAAPEGFFDTPLCARSDTMTPAEAGRETRIPRPTWPESAGPAGGNGARGSSRGPPMAERTKSSLWRRVPRASRHQLILICPHFARATCSLVVKTSDPSFHRKTRVRVPQAEATCSPAILLDVPW